MDPGYVVSPGESLTVQLTNAFVVPLTSAVNIWEKPAFTVALLGVMVRVTGCVVMVTVAVAEAEGLLTLVAVTLATPPAGTVDGAV